MKEVKVMIDITDLKLGEEEQKISPVELVSNVINHTIYSYSQQCKGLNKTERFQVYEIDEQLKKAVKDKLDKIEIADTTCGFLRKCFREVKLNPSELLKKVEENIDDIVGYK
jgi:hypothetical protein